MGKTKITTESTEEVLEEKKNCIKRRAGKSSDKDT